MAKETSQQQSQTKNAAPQNREDLEQTEMGEGTSQRGEGAAATQQARQEGGAEGGMVHEYHTAKIIEIVGASPAGFQQAIETAIKDARETIGDIHGAEVQNMNVEVVNGQIQEYKVDLKVAFGIKGT